VTASAGAVAFAGLLLLAAGGLGLDARHWPALARSQPASVLARRTTCGVRLRRWRRRAGGCGIRCRGGVGETLTRWRSRRPELQLRLRRRPERTTLVILLGRARRRRGCHGAVEDGHATALVASGVSSVRVASSASSTTLWWSDRQVDARRSRRGGDPSTRALERLIGPPRRPRLGRALPW
jgi:hypothetical protein